MKFTQPGRRLLAAGLGTAVLGAAAIAAAVATASLASPAHTATLDAAAQTGPKLVPATARPRPVRAKRPAARPAPVPAPSPAVVGRVVASGIHAGGGELVFYGVRVHVRQLPKVTFGIMAGLRSPAGALTAEVETNETTGSATTPGFHAIEGAMNVGSPGVNVPEFGYYAGPATTITARQGSHMVHASLARWSANPHIVIFWFPTTTTNHTALTSLAAYTATGHRLPAGNTTTGLG
jgi:hypothetical protein